LESLKELDALKEELPNRKWMAQYQQNPTSETSAIVKREWWQVWEKDDPPDCDFTLMSWDTAFEKNNRADYSACTHWGVFYYTDDTGVSRPNIILLNAFRKRMEFPELKQTALDHYNEFAPDSVIIEKKGFWCTVDIRNAGDGYTRARIYTGQKATTKSLDLTLYQIYLPLGLCGHLTLTGQKK
jgi:phage terminase large subunit-like protein